MFRNKHGAHLCCHGNYRLCKSHFISSLFAFRISYILTDICNIQLCFLFSFEVYLALVRTGVGTVISNHISFIIFLRPMLSESVIHLLKFMLQNGASLFCLVPLKALVSIGFGAGIINHISLSPPRHFSLPQSVVCLLSFGV